MCFLSGVIQGFIDPGNFRQGFRTRLLSFKAAGVKIKRLVECLLAMIQDDIGIAVLDGLRGQHGDAGMFMLLVIPPEEMLAVSSCILD